MLNRFRNLARRLELPQEHDHVVYRIIDEHLNTVEVTTAQYALWRVNNDVTKRAIVGQDTVENVIVRTTFSVMPENRSSRPFGTSAFGLPFYEPLLEYSQRYDSWQEAERGHRQTLDRIRWVAAQAQADVEIAQAFAGTASDVREAITAQLPELFSVTRSDNVALVRTPLLMADGTPIGLQVMNEDSGFLIAEVEPFKAETSGGFPPGDLLERFGVGIVDGQMTVRAGTPSGLASAILALSQAISCASFLSPVE